MWKKQNEVFGSTGFLSRGKTYFVFHYVRVKICYLPKIWGVWVSKDAGFYVDFKLTLLTKCTLKSYFKEKCIFGALFVNLFSMVVILEYNFIGAFINHF
jgi:hypothetical protein